MSGSNAKVLDLSSHLHAKKNGGWWTGHVRCQSAACGHQWVEVKPGADAPKNSQCPKCSEMSGVAVHPDVIEVLERALQHAKAGRIKGAVVVQEGTQDGSLTLSHSVYDRLKVLGGLDWAKHSILHEGDYSHTHGTDDDGA